MKEGWEIKNLEEVCLKTSNIKWSDSNGESYDYIDLSSVSRDNYSIMETVKVDENTAPSRAKKIIKTEDIIFATTRPTLKRLTVIPESFDNQICSTGFVVLRPNPQKVVSEFIFYSLLQDSFMDRMESLQRGASYPAVTDSDVKGFEIPIPPLPEQQRIVSILDAAFAAIDKAKANAEQNLQNAKELFESYLQGVFECKGDGWEECNLEDNIKLIDYRGRTPQKTESGVRLITAKNVKLGFLQLEPQEFIAKDNYESWMTRGIPNVGDVIFTTEAPLANVAQIESDEKLAFAQRIIVMQPNRKKLNPTFLKYMLLSGPIRKRILEKGTGATVVGIKSSLLKKILIYFPNTVEEQQTIVRQLDALRAEMQKLEAVYQKKIADLEELKKSILQKAFAGELETERAVAV